MAPPNKNTGRGRGPSQAKTMPKKTSKSATFTSKKTLGDWYTYTDLKTVGFIPSNEIFQLGKLKEIRPGQNRTVFEFIVKHKTYDVWSTAANSAAITNQLEIGFSYAIKGTLYADKKHRYRSASNTKSQFNFRLTKITQIVSKISPGADETMIAHVSLNEINNMIGQKRPFTKTVTNVKITNATIHRYMGCESCTKSLSTWDKKDGKFFCKQCTKTKGGAKQRKLCMVARFQLSCLESTAKIDNIVCFHNDCVELLGTELANKVCNPTRCNDMLARIVAENLIGEQIESCQIRHQKPKSSQYTELRISVHLVRVSNSETLQLIGDVDDGNYGQIIPETCNCDQCQNESQHDDINQNHDAKDEDDDDGDNNENANHMEEDDDEEMGGNDFSIPSGTSSLRSISDNLNSNQLTSNENANTITHIKFSPSNLLPEEYYQLDYNASTKSYGSAIIIDMDFASDTMFARNGSDNDVKALRETFTNLKINIFKELKNISGKELMLNILQFKKHLEVTNASCAFFVIMTHGVQNFIRTNDRIRVNIYQNILAKFSEKKFPMFAEKPKVFIFNACQSGNKARIGFSLLMPDHDLLSNMLICTPCCPGQKSKRNPDTGSYFIQTMTKTFNNFAKEAHLEHMLKMVQDELKDIPVGEEKTERRIPNYTPILFKRFVFPVAFESPSNLPLAQLNMSL